MKAHIEWLEKGRFGIVRSGPHTGSFGKPYCKSAAFFRPKYGPNKAIVKGLSSEGGFNTAHKRAMLAALSRFFDGVRWDRRKPWGVVKIN